MVDNTTKQYVMPISIEEYETQKLDYTQNALKELQPHLAEHVNKQTNIKTKQLSMSKSISMSKKDKHNDIMDDILDDNDNSVIEYTTDSDTVSDGDKNSNEEYNEKKQYKPRNKNKTNVNTQKLTSSKERRILSDYQLGQLEASRYVNQTMVHEYEESLSKHKNTITALRNEINEENKKNHYLKLDLNNVICDNNDNKNKVMQLRVELLDKNKLINIQNDILYKNKMQILALKIILYIQFFIILIMWHF